MNNINNLKKPLSSKDFNSLSFSEKIKFFDTNFKNIQIKYDSTQVKNNTKNIQKKDNNKMPSIIKEGKEKKNKDFFDDFEISDINELEGDINNNKALDDINLDLNLNLDPMWKSDISLNEFRLDLWEILPITIPLKKSKKEYMKSIMSSIVYNGDMFKDKLSESSNKNIIIFDTLYNNFNIKQIKNCFVYMSYRNGLFNTKFLPGNKNDYTSDCGWGCMLRCCQMMLSRAFIKLKNNNFNFNEIVLLFYDKFIDINNMHINKTIFEIYKKILKTKANVVEIIAPYSIYILTLLGNCPNIFTSDHNMIRTIIKINKTLFNENILILHFNGTVNKKKLIENFCEKINDNKKINEIKEIKEYIIYNNEKYIFKKNGIIFISLRLGLQKIEPNFIDMIPKLFINLHNNIGFVSGKKKRAFYFIGINDKKLIFADPHFNQKLETDEINFSSYIFNELYLISVKELSSELTVGVTIKDKKDLEQFFDDLSWFKQINHEFIGYEDK